MLFWPADPIAGQKPASSGPGAGPRTYEIALVERETDAGDAAPVERSVGADRPSTEAPEAPSFPAVVRESFTEPQRHRVGLQMDTVNLAGSIAPGVCGESPFFGSGAGFAASGRSGQRGISGQPVRGVTVDALVAPLPPYPPAARIQRRSGAVQLAVLIDADGRPRATAVAQSSGYDDFDQAARETVQRSWRFPRQLASADDQPLLVVVRFDLVSSAAPAAF